MAAEARRGGSAEVDLAGMEGVGATALFVDDRGSSG